MRSFRNRSGRLPILMIVIALVVALLGVAAFKIFKDRKPAGKQNEKPKVELTAWKLDEFVVNLNDREDSRYLKVDIVLEVEGKMEAGEGDNPDEPKVRDTIINVLTGKSFCELQSPMGKEKLKTQLKSALNAEMDKNKVENIYFTSFAMQ